MAMESFKINGHSMNPLLKDGQFVLGVRDVQDQNFKRYDVVIFETQGRFLCHYIWKKCKNFETGLFDLVQTRPLNPVWEFDEVIKKDKIIAKVFGHRIGFFLKIKILFYTLLLRKKA